MQQVKRKLNSEISILIIQLTVVALIILTVIAVKFLNGDWFNYLKGFYINNFCSDTSTAEVTEAEDDDIIYLSAKTSVITTALYKENSNRLISPTKNINISSAYGYRRDPFGSGFEFHKGIDLAEESGSEIVASASGTIEVSEYSNSYGNYLIINHGSGLKTLYAHCSKLLKNEGDKVIQGEQIALVGTTGRSTGPHLHFEVIINGKNLNPEWLITKQ